MRVLVTGGTGFVGSHTAAAFGAAGHTVRLLARDPARVEAAPALAEVRAALEVHRGDVTDPIAVDAALDGCAAVVHAAALVALDERRARLAHDVNVGGTERVVGGAADRGIPAVHVSTVSLFRAGTTAVTTDAPLNETGGGYARSKVAAERLVRRVRRDGARVVTTYPAGVVGPDAPTVTPTMAALVGWLGTVPRTTSGVSLVDVRDVAAAHVAVVEALAGAGGSWPEGLPDRLMLGGHFLTWDEVAAALGAATGRRVPRTPMPAVLLRAAGRVGDVVMRVRPFEYPLTSEAMRAATRAVPYDSGPTVAALGHGFRPVAETLTDAVRWLAAAGHVTRTRAGRLAP